MSTSNSKSDAEDKKSNSKDGKETSNNSLDETDQEVSNTMVELHDSLLKSMGETYTQSFEGMSQIVKAVCTVGIKLYDWGLIDKKVLGEKDAKLCVDMIL